MDLSPGSCRAPESDFAGRMVSDFTFSHEGQFSMAEMANSDRQSGENPRALAGVPVPRKAMEVVGVGLYERPVWGLEPRGKWGERYGWRLTYYGMVGRKRSLARGSQRVSPQDLDSTGNGSGNRVGSALRCGSAAGGDAESSRAGSGDGERGGGAGPAEHGKFEHGWDEYGRERGVRGRAWRDGGHAAHAPRRYAAHAHDRAAAADGERPEARGGDRGGITGGNRKV